MNAVLCYNDMDFDEEAAFNDAGPSNSGTGGVTPDGQPMSKNAMKKAARQARLLASRPEKRQAEKVRRRERAHYLAAGHAAGTLTAEEEAIFQQRRDGRHARKAVKREEKLGKEEWGGGVVVDLGFDELMSDQEITSMTSQLGYVYSYNRLSSKPFRTILHTSFSPEVSPRLWEKMSKAAWDKWTRSYWWREGVDTLAKAMSDIASSSSGPSTGECTASTSDAEDAARSLEQAQSDPAGADVPRSVALRSFLSGPKVPSTLTPTHKLVYLSADAQEELTTLSEDEIYVIGGIVDRNRYKFLCQNKAEKYGIRTARLPIGTYLANLPTRKVLTVNQVFQILVEYVTRQSWSEAFEAVIPQRKYQPGRKKRKHGDTPGGAEETGDDDDDAEADEAEELAENDQQDNENGEENSTNGFDHELEEQ